MGSIPETPSLNTRIAMAPVAAKGQVNGEEDQSALKIQLDLENHVGSVHVDDLLGAAEPMVLRTAKQENVFLFIPNLIGTVVCPQNRLRIY